MHKTYSAVNVTINSPTKPISVGIGEREELVFVNLKSGHTEQAVDTRMNQYDHQYWNGSTSQSVHKLRYNVDNGRLEGGYWMSTSAKFSEGFATQTLHSMHIFYKNLDVGRNWRSEEQKLINTNRKIAEEFTNTKVKIVLHHGLPTDRRSNPDPFEKGINEEYYKQLKEEIRKKLKQAIEKRSENNPEFIKVKKAISDAQKKLKELKSAFLGEQPELLAIEI